MTYDDDRISAFTHENNFKAFAVIVVLFVCLFVCEIAPVQIIINHLKIKLQQQLNQTHIIH